MTTKTTAALVALALASTLGMAQAAESVETKTPPVRKATLESREGVTGKGAADTRRANRLAGLETFDAVRLDLPAGIPESVEFELSFEGRTEKISLTRTSMRSANARLLVDRGGGVLVEEPLPPHRTYRGSVVSEGPARGALVAASIIDGQLRAMIDLPESTLWVQPAADFEPGRPATEHAVFRRSAPAGDFRCGFDDAGLSLPDWMQGIPTDPLGENEDGGKIGEEAPMGGTDGGDSGGGDSNGGSGGGGGEGGVAGTTPFVAEIGFDADFEFYQLNSSNLTSTLNDIETIMNNVALVYDRDVNVTYEYTTFIVRTVAADPYTSTDMGVQLCEFRNTWNANAEVQIQRDVAQLYTGKNVDGSTIGLAWLGVVCNQAGNACSGTNNLAYSTVQSRFSTGLDFRTALSAHELGHNWSAPHCDAASPCNIMCSGLNGCQGVSGSNLRFSTNEQTSIVNYRNSVSCDPALPSPITLPFTDTFDASSAIDGAKWIYSKGAATTTAAVSEPSPTRSLNLDALGALEYGDDEIRSNYMLLAGIPTVILNYWTQHVGVESGEQLVVEYLNSSLKWTAINTITSTGVNQTTFTEWTHTLPANAKHNKFRLRFRALVDGQDDDWFIDSVSLSTVDIPNNDECSAAGTITDGTFPFNTTNATDSATALPASCNEGAGTTVKNDIWYLYEPTCTGNLTVTTCGTAAFDTRLAAYSLACPTIGFLLGCSDNGAGCTGGTSSMTFQVVVGTAVFIRVGGATGGGTGSISIFCNPTSTPCPTDFDEDGVTGASDLAFLLNSWGTADADLDGDGTTGAPDLAALLNSWGACE
jgi:hypothetical protein